VSNDVGAPFVKAVDDGASLVRDGAASGDTVRLFDQIKSLKKIDPNDATTRELLEKYTKSVEKDTMAVEWDKMMSQVSDSPTPAVTKDVVGDAVETQAAAKKMQAAAGDAPSDTIKHTKTKPMTEEEIAVEWEKMMADDASDSITPAVTQDVVSDVGGMQSASQQQLKAEGLGREVMEKLQKGNGNARQTVFSNRRGENISNSRQGPKRRRPDIVKKVQHSYQQATGPSLGDDVVEGLQPTKVQRVDEAGKLQKSQVQQVDVVAEGAQGLPATKGTSESLLSPVNNPNVTTRPAVDTLNADAVRQEITELRQVPPYGRTREVTDRLALLDNRLSQLNKISPAPVTSSGALRGSRTTEVPPIKAVSAGGEEITNRGAQAKNLTETTDNTLGSARDDTLGSARDDTLGSAGGQDTGQAHGQPAGGFEAWARQNPWTAGAATVGGLMVANNLTSPKRGSAQIALPENSAVAWVNRYLD